MSEKQDQQFFDTFMVVLGALVFFAFAMFALAKLISNRTQIAYQAEDPAHLEVLQERIQPLGRVAIAGQAKPVVAAVAVSAEPKVMSGEEVYNVACVACHSSAVASALGSPEFGNAAAWAPRIAKGIEALNASALGGIGAMPAKGGRADLSDENIILAVQYMVDQAQ